MSHRPFEEWILAGEALNPEEQASLRDHMMNCAACQELALSWQEVEPLLMQAALERPSPGFVERWIERVEERDRRRQTRLNWLALLISAGSAVTIALLWLAGYLSASPPLTVLLHHGIESLRALLVEFWTIQELLEALLQTLPAAFLLIWWIAAAALTVLAALWVLSVHRLAASSQPPRGYRP